MKKKGGKGVCFLFLQRKSLTGICQRSRIAHWNGECFVSLHIFFFLPPAERFLILQTRKTVSHCDVPLILKKNKKKTVLDISVHNAAYFTPVIINPQSQFQFDSVLQMSLDMLHVWAVKLII